MNTENMRFDPECGLKNLVLEGGGIKSLAHSGVAQALEDHNLLHAIECFAGTSGGAISASLLAAGYTASEMETILLETDFNKFKDGAPLGRTQELYNLWYYYGLYKNNYLKRWLGDLLEAKLGDKDITFQGLFKKTHKRLRIYASNLGTSHLVEYSTRYTPGMIIREAVKISSLVPVFYMPHYNDKGECLVDGGLFMNYAIPEFDEELDVTLGIRYSNDGLEPRFRTNDTLVRYLVNIIRVLLYQVNNCRMSPANWKHTATIQTDVEPLDFDLSEEEQKELIQAGYDSVENYINNL